MGKQVRIIDDAVTSMSSARNHTAMQDGNRELWKINNGKNGNTAERKSIAICPRSSLRSES